MAAFTGHSDFLFPAVINGNDCRLSPYAQIASEAKIGRNVVVGAFSVIGPNVILDDDVRVYEHAIIKGRTVIKKGSEIYPFSTIGLASQDKKCLNNFEGAVEIGEHTTIREHVSIHGPTTHEGLTQIGSHSLIMGQSHIAHDCIIKNHVVISQASILGGHVLVDDYAIVGGGTGIHQFVHIGKYAMVGGASKVERDVAPFGLANGNFCELLGVNVVGLRRHGFSLAQLRALKKAFAVLFTSGLQQQQALSELEQSNDENIAELLCFIKRSRRGLTPLRR